MPTIEWSQPQRQPAAGLLITFLHTIGKLLKQLWPLLLIVLIRGRASNVNWYEIVAGAFLFFSIVETTWRFFYFRFYIEAEKLVVKSGWLKKTTVSIPLGNIQSVEISQGPVHQVLSLVKLSIDTAGSQKSEATIESLRKPMAEALRERLLQAGTQTGMATLQKPAKEIPLLQLTDTDLLKLSFSANHLKAFFLFFAFASGLYNNFSSDEDSFLRGLTFLFTGDSFYPFFFLTSALLLITVLISSGDVFLRFHEFSVFKRTNGFSIRSGLFQVKEKLVAVQKVQFISWQASWMRKKLGLWMLEYHIAGAHEASVKTRTKIPVTQRSHLPLLVNDYYPIPAITDEAVIRIHPVYVYRRFWVAGLLPGLLLLLLFWQAWGNNALLFLLYPVVVLAAAWLRKRKFRLWAMHDVLYLKRGTLGEERILLQWHKVQYVALRQSIYQRKKALATVVIYTAGGEIYLPFVSLQAARQLVNFTLYKTETSQKNWL